MRRSPHMRFFYTMKRCSTTENHFSVDIHDNLFVVFCYILSKVKVQFLESGCDMVLSTFGIFSADSNSLTCS